jgi:carbon-monoxide dehydrogenase small subunit
MIAISESAGISLTVNGRTVSRHTTVRVSLADFLRYDLGLTGTHVGCEQGVCGACTILIDGEIVRSCLMLAVQADGCSVETIEGLSDSDRIRNLQNAFVQHNGCQCGFCTPGMLITAQALLKHDPSPTRERIRDFLSGNYCRCTGYQAIIDAIEAAAGEGVRALGGAA